MLHLQIPLPPKITSRLRHLHPNNILNSKPELAIGIISRLVRDHMPRLEGSLVVYRFGAYSLWSFVDVKEVADAMPCAMAVVEAVGPEVLAGENIEGVAWV